MKRGQNAERLVAVRAYLDNPNDESWKQLLHEIMSDLGGVTVTLNDLCIGFDRTVDVNVFTKHGLLYVAPKGYGEPESDDGEGQTVFMELYQDALRLVYCTDINDQCDRIIVSLEGAREDQRAQTDDQSERTPIPVTRLSVASSNVSMGLVGFKEKNPQIIADVEMGESSYWIHLNEGWCNTEQCSPDDKDRSHIFHEDSEDEVIEAFMQSLAPYQIDGESDEDFEKRKKIEIQS